MLLHTIDLNLKKRKAEEKRDDETKEGIRVGAGRNNTVRERNCRERERKRAREREAEREREKLPVVGQPRTQISVACSSFYHFCPVLPAWGHSAGGQRLIGRETWRSPVHHMAKI